MTYDGKVAVPLYEIAHGRTGDKGDRSTLSIIPYDPSAYAVIAEQATEERMLSMFRHRGATEIQDRTPTSEKPKPLQAQKRPLKPALPPKTKISYTCISYRSEDEAYF